MPLTREQWDSVRASMNKRCIVWRGAHDMLGYGIKAIGHTKQIRAHRWAWLLFNGEAPPGTHIHHRCENRACINPVHLELMTAEQHYRHHADKAKRTTPCPRGHEFNEQNFHPRKRGRRCLVCHREHEAARKREKRMALELAR